jgi:AmpE protein
VNLFIIVIAILFLQVWGADNPLHKDQWVGQWVAFLQKQYQKDSGLLFLLAVGIPLFSATFAFWMIAVYSPWLILPLGVLIVSYSFGRGEFGQIVDEYTKACYSEDWESGVNRAKTLGVDTDLVDENDWVGLHQRVLEEAGYRGFERMFAVLFWFFALGPIGALLYRLVFLFGSHCKVANEDEALATSRRWVEKTLWVLEWPAVRLLGLSFALTGNFVGCFSRWKESVLCVKRSTVKTLSESILGALSVDQDIAQTCDVTQRELSLLDRLYVRTLWFWLAMAAVLIILI